MYVYVCGICVHVCARVKAWGRTEAREGPWAVCSHQFPISSIETGCLVKSLVRLAVRKPNPPPVSAPTTSSAGDIGVCRSSCF